MCCKVYPNINTVLFNHCVPVLGAEIDIVINRAFP